MELDGSRLKNNAYINFLDWHLGGLAGCMLLEKGVFISYSCYPAELCIWWSLWGAPSGLEDPRTPPVLDPHSRCYTSPPLCSAQPCSKALPPCAGSLTKTRNTHSLCKVSHIIYIMHPKRASIFHHVGATWKLSKASKEITEILFSEARCAEPREYSIQQFYWLLQ